MRKVTSGTGVDTTAAVAAFLRTSKTLFICRLYLIGEADDPNAIWLTDWDTPIEWSWTGIFKPTSIKIGSVTTQVGFDPQKVTITWAPKPQSYAQTLSTATFKQLANAGYYTNWKVRVWKCYMPTPGDANTYGASELFGGRIGEINTDRGAIEISVEAFINALEEQVPPNMIEVLSTAAAYIGATPPSGFVRIPKFDVVLGSSTNAIVGDQTFPVAHSILTTNNCQGGFLVFNAGGTLDGYWGAIQQNTQITVGGTNYNQFILYSPLPWPPTPGVDSFYVSGPSPINSTDAEYIGFPYVPSATQGF